MTTIKYPELTPENPGVLIKVDGKYVGADQYIQSMVRHNHWAAGAYERQCARADEADRAIYKMLDTLPIDLLEEYLDQRREYNYENEDEA